MDNSIDLHVHSTFSDGTYTIDEIANLAKELQLKALALTDHDCIDGNSKMAQLCKDAGIDFIPGIELSTGYITPSGTELEIHMLGYYVTPTDNLNSYLEEFRYTRDHRNEAVVEKLNEHGYHFTFQEFKDYFPDGILTRAHIARFLYEKEMVSSRQEAFDKLIGDGCCCFVPRKKASAKEAIELVHKSGGLAFLAHPTLYKLDYKGIRTLMSDLKELGLDGVEGIYSTYKNEEEATIKQYAKELNLLISGGSDFHGANKPYIHLGSGRGNLQVPYKIYESIYNRHTM